MENLSTVYDLIAITFYKDSRITGSAIVNGSGYLNVDLSGIGSVKIESRFSFSTELFFYFKSLNSSGTTERCEVRLKHKDLTDLYNIDEYLDYIEVTEGQELKSMYHLVLKRLETANINLNDKFKIGKNYGL